MTRSLLAPSTHRHARPHERVDRPTPTATTAMRALVENVERVVIGKTGVVELAVVTAAAGGHLLIADVPGLGKTLLARALARSVDGSVTRIQGAPDLLPADLTGGSVFRPDRGEFVFVPGPIFANVVVVDEANRTTPRTQAALLEAMEEGAVSVDGVTHPLPRPHLVIATQNPVEQHGTFPLPESQLDRFTAATSMGYPAPTHELAVVRGQVHGRPVDQLGPIMSVDDLAAVQRDVRAVDVAEEVLRYAVALVGATRGHADVLLGASPRAAVQLVHAAQARAAMEGRAHVLPDDVKALAAHVLAHRLLLRGDARREDVVRDLLGTVPVR